MVGFLEAHESNLPYFEKTNYRYKLFTFFLYSEIQLVYCPEFFLNGSLPGFVFLIYRKTCVRPKIGFQDQLLLNAGQMYCRMLQGEHSAVHLTFIKLPFVNKIFVLSIFEWLFYTGFTVCRYCYKLCPY